MNRDIIDLIDGAIADYTSPDAMRWAPETPAPIRQGFGLVVVVDEIENLEAPTAEELSRGIALGSCHFEDGA